MKLEPPGAQERALAQLISGCLNDAQAPLHVALNTLISLYRHLVVTNPQTLPEGIQTAGELTGHFLTVHAAHTGGNAAQVAASPSTTTH